MRAWVVDEPELEFGLGRHLDIRHGIAELRPLDFRQGREVTVGIVGTAESTAALGSWLESATHGLPAKGSRLPNLFPDFPGFSTDSPFGTSLAVDPRRSVELTARQLDRAIEAADPARAGGDLFVDAITQALDKGRPDAFICALPPELLAVTDEPDPTALLEEGDPSGPAAGDPTAIERTDLRDYMKAVALACGVPLQLIRPETYGLGVRKRKKAEHPRRLQDPATRAWNFFVALYYKAGGTPWRMVRAESDLATCYVGVAFFRSADAETVQTAMAQVFNERGQGVVVRGGPVRMEKDDRVPHLDAEGAGHLLATALSRYRDEHLTLPARIVLHKSSFHDPAELAGFQRAADDAGIGVVDLLSVGSSPARLFRTQPYPVLRGTTLQLTEDQALMYTRGSVQFFETYPGMYVPHPVLLRADRAHTPLDALAREMLGLTKMNWNNTQFDGAKPITLRAAQEVGRILRYVPAGLPIQSNYAFYM